MQPPQSTVASIRKPLRRADLAELFGVSLKTIDNRRKAGELPPSFTSGNERLWRPQDVEAWMAERVAKELEAAEQVGEEAQAEKSRRGRASGMTEPLVRGASKSPGARPASASLRRLQALHGA